MPAWGYEDDATPSYAQFIENPLDRQVFRFRLTNEGDCDCMQLDGEIIIPCCGCANLAWKYADDDMEPCEVCDKAFIHQWRQSIAGRPRRRDVVHVDDNQQHPSPALPLSEDSIGDVSDSSNALSAPLSKRGPGKATMGSKYIRACGTDYPPVADSRYPSFPYDPTWPWDGIENGRWDSISKYWGNSSSSCQLWYATALSKADKTLIPGPGGGPGTWHRASYQTEHVFEGQLISDFFDEWLTKGKIKNQLPRPLLAIPRTTCSWIRDYVEKPTSHPFTVNNKRGAKLVDAMAWELGNIRHMDRLTIMLSRPNGKKGRVRISQLFHHLL